MKIINKLFYFFLFVLLSLYSCDDPIRDELVGVSATDLLVSNKWEMSDFNTKINYQVVGISIEDEEYTYDEFEECDKDDIFHFKSGGIFNYESNEVKCDSNEPDVIEEGTWILNNDQQTLTINSDKLFEGEMTFRIKTLSTVNLVLEADHSQELTIQGFPVKANFEIQITLKPDSL